MSLDPSLLSTVRWRCIGPPRGGRVVAVSGHPANPAVFYFGACAGGVWKSDDAGQYWRNISDGYFKTAAIGAIAVAPSDANVIYVGTGEHTIRIDVSHGDGVYKSTDGGDSWRNVGLTDTRHIAKIRIHPQNPDLVYVAALGHAFGPNEERGVFRSQDGGQNWEKVLHVSDKAGAVDLAMDSNNPRILYASIYETYRHFWTLSSGGPDSGLYKSTDGGDTWQKLSDNKGFPKGIKGKIGVALSPAKTGRVWALVEAEEAGLYRSDDGGESWQMLTDKRELRVRPWYYCHVYGDPQDADTVYVLNLRMWKSTDGGKNFSEISTPHGDNHDLWINPDNPQTMIEGNDGGACVSLNGGASWSSIYNQLTSQFYHVAVDSQFPYRVYGTQQDNSSISVPSRTGEGAITWAHCYPAGTGESGHIAVNPENPDIVFVGAIGSSPGGGGPLQKYDHRTKQTSLVTVWPESMDGWGAAEWKYRFQWTYPILFSPHDPNILYATGNIVFRSTNEGRSWEAISPDLTRADPDKLVASGGPITKDTTGAENYATVYAFSESPHEAGVFWAGSDDGLVHISQNGGETWEAITPEQLPEWTLISMIEPSPHDPASAYLAATRYKLDDPRPFLYKTNDYGRSWEKIVSGIPDDDFTRVIREDPAQRGLLYAGTETAVYVSFDDGATWQVLSGNLPVVPIYDLVVKENDLVAATHGRSFWILDDLTALHQLVNLQPVGGAALLKPRDTHRLPIPIFARLFEAPEDSKQYHVTLGVNATYYVRKSEAGERLYDFLDAGEDPPEGVVINYYFKEKPAGEVTLTLQDASGDAIRTFSSQKPVTDDEDGDTPKEPIIPAEAGMNRFVWNMHYPDATRIKDDKSVPVDGPMASPGKYQVQLSHGEDSWVADFKLLKDPRVTASQADLDAKFELLLQIRDKLSQANEAINQLRDVREQADGWLKRLADRDELIQAREAAEALIAALTTIEEQLVQTKALTDSDFMSLEAMPVNRLSELPNVMSSADTAPTRQTFEVFDHLSSRIDELLTQFQTVLDHDVVAFNRLAQQADVPAIVIWPS
ncbi:MAG: glycosyl hydrolase [Chloroflexota bacterium]|nr:MAG: glycosyl hydrolase [Chloroflexota bacterium]